MVDLSRKLAEDRAVRDAAKQLIEADLGIVKEDVKDRGVGQRAADVLGAESRNIAEKAIDYSVERPLLVSGILVAILALFFRNTIIDAVIAWLDRSDEDESVDVSDEAPAETEPAERYEPNDSRPQTNNHK